MATKHRLKKSYLFSPLEEKVFVRRRLIGYVYPLKSYSNAEFGYWSLLGDVGAEGHHTKEDAIKDLKEDHAERLRELKKDFKQIKKALLKWIGLKSCFKL